MTKSGSGCAVSFSVTVDADQNIVLRLLRCVYSKDSSAHTDDRVLFYIGNLNAQDNLRSSEEMYCLDDDISITGKIFEE